MQPYLMRRMACFANFSVTAEYYTLAFTVSFADSRATIEYAGVAVQDPNFCHLRLAGLVSHQQDSKGLVHPSNSKIAAQEHFRCFLCMEEFHAGLPGTAADAQVLHITPANEQSGLCIHHLAEQHPSDEGPPLHVSGHYCTMEIKVHTDQHVLLAPLTKLSKYRIQGVRRQLIPILQSVCAFDWSLCYKVAVAASMAISH